MNAQQIQERYAGHPFVDYFDCLDASLKAARNRNRLAVRAKKAGDYKAAARHLAEKRWHMRRCRAWYELIDWSEE